MTSRFKMTVAAAALLAGTGFAYAQGTGMSHEGGAAGGASAQQSAPSSERGGATERGGAAQQQMNHTRGASEDKSPAAGSNQRAEDSVKGDKSKSMSSENDKSGSKDMKAEGRQDQKNQKAEGREDKNNMKAEGREDRNGTMNAQKGGAEGRTVGQAGAGAKLSTEQRTKITTVIKNEHVAPITNINFNVSVGTRVPHDVAFHPLPADVVTIYPEWRGYNFVLVRDEIVVIDPDSFEIVAVSNS
jgi:hypothetical protein